MSSYLPPNQIIEEFKKRKKIQWTAFFPVVFMIFILLIWGDQRRILGIRTEYITYAALGLMLIYGILFIRNWRCPSCDRILGKHLNPSSCPKCGVPFRAE